MYSYSAKSVLELSRVAMLFEPVSQRLRIAVGPGFEISVGH